VRLWVLALLLAGCEVEGHFKCVRDEQCRLGEETGVCIERSCAFVDDTCASGLRYARSADPEIEGTCVPAP
jgi:hypothetical protein